MNDAYNPLKDRPDVCLTSEINNTTLKNKKDMFEPSKDIELEVSIEPSDFSKISVAVAPDKAKNEAKAQLPHQAKHSDLQVANELPRTWSVPAIAADMRRPTERGDLGSVSDKAKKAIELQREIDGLNIVLQEKMIRRD